ncbi:MAG: transcription termination factor NusA [Thermosulfidibacteraceae bacterium]|jgi:N utilization substance protein A
MKGKELLYTIKVIEEEKGIPKEDIIALLEEAILTAIVKRIDRKPDLKVQLNLKEGEFKVYARKRVVEDGGLKNPDKEISLSEALKIDPDVKVGDIVEIPFNIEGMSRIIAQASANVLSQRIDKLEIDRLYRVLQEKVGDIVVGEIVKEDEKGNVVVKIHGGKVQAILLPEERVKTERYRKGDVRKFLLVGVKKKGNELEVILSRTHPKLLQRLFEKELPEVSAGIVKVVSVARDPGDRSKVAVTSSDPTVDPVGACIGVRGSRIQTIVRELQGENIDVILYSEDPKEFIANALKPARVNNILLDWENKEAKVFVDEDQFALAIGKKGQNARLTAKLTGWKIDIKVDALKNTQSS